MTLAPPAPAAPPGPAAHPGGPSPPAGERLCFRVAGLDCAHEVELLEQVLLPLVGDRKRLSFDVVAGRLAVEPGGRTDAAPLAADQVVQAVASTGMVAVPIASGTPSLAAAASAVEERALARMRLRRTLLTVASGVLIVAAFVEHAVIEGSFAEAFGSGELGHVHHVPGPAKLLFALAILAGGMSILPKAWAALRHRRPDMNLLMTVAVLGAVGINEWFEAAAVTFLFSLSLDLEAWSVARARRAVGALMDLSPPSVRLIEGGMERVVSPSAVAVGSLFLVKPGERIALDGAVVGGGSEVNEAPITGESLPVHKEPGDPVFAGSINGSGALEVCSTRAAGDTTLAHLIASVAEAQARRAPVEMWVERFARIYTPAVLVLAVAVALGPPALGFGAWEEWFYRSLVLLVIACPCALVISTPVSLVAGLATAARHGVLIKGGQYLEAPARLRAIAFDKTGTLTRGAPEVVRVVPLSGHDERELLAIAAALEARSEHPLARAVVHAAHARGISYQPVSDFRSLEGRGATALLDGERYWLGSHRYLEERGQETPEMHALAEAMAAEGLSVLAVGNEEHVCGLIALADALRPEAPAALQKLRDEGIEHLVLLTGDNRTTAETIARRAGVDMVRADLLPHDKVAAVEELVHRYGAVAMVGDGVNDAPAMGRASLGIAMGAAGADAVIETCDVALMGDELEKLPWLVRHARRTLRTIRQNIVFALGLKLAFLVATGLGYASLWAAIAADMGASLLVIANGLRLLRAEEER
jgi:Cd2+/Zn2+-exporting ATPase